MEAGGSKLEKIMKAVDTTNKVATNVAGVFAGVINNVADAVMDDFNDDLKTFDTDYKADLILAGMLIHKDMDFGNIKVEICDCSKEFKLYAEACDKLLKKCTKRDGMTNDLVEKMEKLRDQYNTQNFGKSKITVSIDQAYKIQKQDRLELDRFLQGKVNADVSIERAIEAYKTVELQQGECIEPRRFNYAINMFNDFYMKACKYKRKQYESCIKVICSEYNKYKKKDEKSKED